MAMVFDTSGKEVKGAYVAGDGKTYLSNGQRIPVGYRVMTGDGNMYEMGKDGKGALVRQISDNNRGTVNDFTGANVQEFTTPKLRTGHDLASMFNIDNDVASIEAKMKGAIDKKFDELDVAYKRLEGQYGDKIGEAANMALDTLRRTKSDAIQNGASAARDAATALSAMLGIGQQASAGAQELAMAGGQLVDKRASERAAVPQAALEYANNVNSDLGKLAYQLNSNDVARYGSDINALIGLDANESGILSQNATNASNERIAAAQAQATVAAAQAGAAAAARSGGSPQGVFSQALAEINALPISDRQKQYLSNLVITGGSYDDKAFTNYGMAAEVKLPGTLGVTKAPASWQPTFDYTTLQKNRP